MHQPTLRVLQLLEHIARHSDGQRLSDLSRELQIPKSTLLPILQTLCQHRYLSHDDSGRYNPGTALFCLATSFADGFPVLTYAREQLDLLVQELGETCYLGVLDDGYVLYLEKVESPQPLRMLTTVGRRLPAYATGIGKALLTGKTVRQLQELYPDGLKPLTEHTVTDYGLLARQLQQAMLDGYAWESEESTPHVRCFAVPIRKHGAVVAALSVTIPLFRYQEEDKGRILAALQESAERIGTTLEQTNAHFGEFF